VVAEPQHAALAEQLHQMVLGYIRLFPRSE
jgi:hypothetical protein